MQEITVTKKNHPTTLLLEPRITGLISNNDLDWKGEWLFEPDRAVHKLTGEVSFTKRGLPVLSETGRASLEAALQKFEAHLAPCCNKAFAVLYAKMISSYPTQQKPLASHESIVADYYDDLGEYPEWAIEEAYRSYRRDPENKWMPASGVLRQKCHALVHRYRQGRDRVKVLLDGAPKYTPKRETGLRSIADIMQANI